MVEMNYKTDVSLQSKGFPISLTCTCRGGWDPVVLANVRCTVSLLNIQVHSVSTEFGSMAYSEAPALFVKSVKSLCDFWVSYRLVL